MRENAILYMTFALFLVISITLVELGLSSDNSSITDRVNWLGYNLGLKIGKNLESNDVNINMTMFLRGLDDGRHGITPLLTDKQVSQASEIVMMIMQCQAAAGNSAFQSYDESFINNVPQDKGTIYQEIFKY